ncbi:MAG: PAS domain S-box protein [Chloroflexi bacterium]|nr:PAS domain S-box protein [Chloroflexota bacterium]
MNTSRNNNLTGNDQKQNDLVMQTSLQLLPLIMNNIPQAVFWKDRNLVYLGCNKAFADDAGFSSPEDVVGKTDFDMPWKAQAELYRADDSLVMEKGEPKINYEEPQTTPDGSTIWLSTSKIPVRENGQVVAVLGMYEDVTARKQVEKELLLRDRALASSLNAVVILNLQDSKPIYVNDAILKMTGYTREEVMRVGLSDITGNPAAPKEIRAAIQTQGFFVGEELIQRKDGSVFPANFFSSLITDDKGQPIAVQSTFFDITEHRQAQEAVRQSQARFQGLVETLGEWVWEVDSQGTYTYISPNIKKLLGYEPEEVLGKTPFDLMPPEEAQRVAGVFGPLLSTQQPLVGLENINRHKDGRLVVLETNGVPFFDANGQLEGYRGTDRDITERKRAEDKLKQNVNFTSALLDAVPTPVFYKDNKGIYQGCNRSFTDIMGVTSEEIKGKTVHQLWPSENAEIYHQKDMDLMRKVEHQVYEATIKDKDGIIRPVIFAKDVFYDESGNVAGLVGAFLDITERKYTEQALRENQQLLQLVMDNIPQSVFWKDKNLTYLGVNQAFAEDAGFTSPQEIVGRNDFDMPWKEQAELYRADDQRVLEGGEPKLNYEEPQTGPAGQVTWLRTSKIPMREANGNIFAVLGMYEDITERKKVEEQIRIFQAMAEASTDAIFMADPNTTELLYANAAALQVYQMPEMVGTLGVKLWPEENVPYLQQVALPQILDTGWKGEAPQVRGNGSVFDTDVTAFALRDATDTPTHLVVMVRDVTERKRLEREVQEAFERRGYQVQVSTEVSQEIAAATETNELFDRVVNLTKERFGYYHTQLLRYDPAQDAVVLINGYGATGRKMLAAGHKMVMGEGLIGTAAATGETVMRPTLADDPDWLPNPLLPETKGEIAVPIKWQDTVLGVLDVQSDQAGALTEDDRLLLEGLCGQIAIAIRSTELLETIRQNETRLAEAATIAQLGYWEFDALTDMYTFTDQFYALLRTTAEREGGYQMSSREYARRFMHPDDRHLVNSEIQKSIETTDTDHIEKFENRFIRADGSEGYVTGRSRVVKDAEGRTVKTVGFNQDITERKQAEAALQRSEQLMRTVIDSTPDWIFIKDQDHRYQLANKGYADALHIASENFIGKNDLDLGFPEELVKGNPEKGIRGFWTDDRLVMDKNETQIYPDDPATIDGVVHNFHTIKIPLQNPDGKVWGVLAFARDITERKQAEARLAEALRTARLANWEYDVEKDLFTFNDQFYAIFHATAEQAGGYQISSARYAELFVHPEDVHLVGAEIGKALSSTERMYTVALDHRILYADGGVGFITVKVTVERDENGKITRFYGANQDITERKAAEEALRRSQQEMADRLEEINRLYQAMSREGWKTYRQTKNLPTGFMFDRNGIQPADPAWAVEGFTHIPMKVLGGEVVGNLAVADDPERPISKDDLDFLQQVSEQVALALEGARLSAQTQSALAQTEKLSEAGLQFTRASDLQELVKIAAEALDIPSVNRAALETFTYNAENEVVGMDVIANWWSGTGHQPTAVGTHYTAEILPLLKLFLTSSPNFIQDAFTDERVDEISMQIIKMLNVRAVAVLPLFLADRQLGVLLLEAEQPHNFTQDEVRLFTAMGPQISTVLENRRQFERAQKQAERESTLNVISQKIQSATTVEAVLQIAARELGHALGAPMTIAQLSMKDKK